MIVIDASVALAWIVASQRTDGADALRTSAEQYIVPANFAFEIRNALLALERRGRVKAVEGDLALVGSVEPLIKGEKAPDLGILTETVRLARQQGLNFYDAAYLELAIRRSATLASRDGALLAAAAQCGVKTLDVR